MKSRIEIMDSTLRDGEQTNGVSFLPHEKLMIARLLLEKVNVDRLEVASARVSEGEKEAVTGICRFAEQAGYLDRIEVLGFVDHNKSVDWIADTGCHVINLLAKGSYKHCTQQLHKTPEQHIEDILDVLDYAESKHFRVNLYLEDWSSGMINSPEYVYQMMEAMKDTNIERFLLPDTLGILTPTASTSMPTTTTTWLWLTLSPLCDAVHRVSTSPSTGSASVAAMHRCRAWRLS